MDLKTLQPAERFSGIEARAFDLPDRAYEFEAQGRDIIHLSVGDPDFDTPVAIVESAIQSLRNGRTHYAPIPGQSDLRAAIAGQTSAQSGVAVDPDQVIVFSGAQNALFATMLSVAGSGDEVILCEPTYTTYQAVAKAGDANVVRVAATAEDGFQVDPNAIAAAITPNTRTILLNSPGNPSGTVLSRDHVQAIVDLCHENDIWLVSDEVYWPYVYEGEHVSPLSLSGGSDVTFVISSLSKSHAMTGWRVGWTIAPKPVAHQLVNVAQCMLFGVNQFVQDAAVTALTQPHPELAIMRDAFVRRRDRLYTGLSKIAGLRTHAPAGGMFLVVDVSEAGLDGAGFTERLLEEAGVSVVPGFGFGESMRNFVRIGFLCDEQILDAAVARIASFMKGLDIK